MVSHKSLTRVAMARTGVAVRSKRLLILPLFCSSKHARNHIINMQICIWIHSHSINRFPFVRVRRRFLIKILLLSRVPRGAKPLKSLLQHCYISLHICGCSRKGERERKCLGLNVTREREKFVREWQLLREWREGERLIGICFCFWASICQLRRNPPKRLNSTIMLELIWLRKKNKHFISPYLAHRSFPSNFNWWSITVSIISASVKINLTQKVNK